MINYLYEQPFKREDFREAAQPNLYNHTGVGVNASQNVTEHVLALPTETAYELFEEHERNCDAFFFGGSDLPMTFSAWRNKAGVHIHKARKYNNG